jgi:hypothetical protein
MFIFDWRHRRFAFGPFVSAGRVTLCHLGPWDFVRAGRVWKIVKHTPWETPKES